MKIELITQVITLLALMHTLYFQIRNFIKYKETDHANVKRILLMLITICFGVHTVRLMFGHANGFFFTAGVIIFLLIYNDWIEKLVNKLKSQWK